MRKGGGLTFVASVQPGSVWRGRFANGWRCRVLAVVPTGNLVAVRYEVLSGQMAGRDAAMKRTDFLRACEQEDGE